MRIFFLVVVNLLIFSVVAQAQEKYHILHVKGEIRYKDNNELLKTKDVVSNDQEIIFGSKDAMAAAISSKRGRYLLKVTPDTESQSELVALVKDVVLESSGKLSTRNSLNTFFELQNYLKGNHVFLGDSAYLQINQVNMPMTDQQFFFLRYDFEGESINKRLYFKEDKLYFIPGEIYKVDDKPINPEFAKTSELVYYNVLDHTTIQAGPFQLVFLNNEEIKEEVSLILDMNKEETAEVKKSEVQAYISEVYGKVYSIGFNAWFEDNF